ncbi:hypothetical protein PC116_g22491 [Phytophthora cactorum]|uniref:Uncharacterized protein n=1 Tax=Phytophthora cactorum TaxID=29920 RepID=A0A8T1K4U8_9STRA|nr:hypothetical protein PC114_g25809 [Phytophthora cactorum]KAG2909264.1 hypothetical protein PC117_g19720 [Phytophthora cactorum]KAG2981043.1 hypothetical protein PC120_g24850 [Phytophthora cactorum]KAG2987836.1 hypothetical protein PC119_g19586 [Phytophthora cactorum]KAG4047562.1 hypothetical protein PC123_g17085 [Phytophthora cactorum]
MTEHARRRLQRGQRKSTQDGRNEAQWADLRTWTDRVYGTSGTAK